MCKSRHKSMQPVSMLHVHICNHITKTLQYNNMTRSTITSLIAHDCRLDFTSQTQSFLNTLSISQLKSPRFDWSAFAGCFSQAPWQDLQVV